PQVPGAVQALEQQAQVALEQQAQVALEQQAQVALEQQAQVLGLPLQLLPAKDACSVPQSVRHWLSGG
ncbi:hypothetical protein, partial [Thiolapillus sp.]|uniref:hypothetical protein n=1 Tax=Thiolapillus sp. TaxID=2017437 RepID=UPI003AF46399